MANAIPTAYSTNNTIVVIYEDNVRSILVIINPFISALSDCADKCKLSRTKTNDVFLSPIPHRSTFSVYFAAQKTATDDKEEISH
ncbi:hypothetical protein Barb7_01511 [Bacteroidales bacterium Barb7]|nr:hypothetical protein Barb7_01511 [Bacteroidales bacterium Barb7]